MSLFMTFLALYVTVAWGNWACSIHHTLPASDVSLTGRPLTLNCTISSWLSPVMSVTCIVSR